MCWSWPVALLFGLAEVAGTAAIVAICLAIPQFQELSASSELHRQRLLWLVPFLLSLCVVELSEVGIWLSAPGPIQALHDNPVEACNACSATNTMFTLLACTAVGLQPVLGMLFAWRSHNASSSLPRATSRRSGGSYLRIGVDSRGKGHGSANGEDTDSSGGSDDEDEETANDPSRLLDDVSQHVACEQMPRRSAAHRGAIASATTRINSPSQRAAFGPSSASGSLPRRKPIVTMTPTHDDDDDSIMMMHVVEGDVGESHSDTSEQSSDATRLQRYHGSGPTAANGAVTRHSLSSSAPPSDYGASGCVRMIGDWLSHGSERFTIPFVLSIISFIVSMIGWIIGLTQNVESSCGYDLTSIAPMVSPCTCSFVGEHGHLVWSIHYSCQWLTLLPNAFAYFLCLHFALMFYAPFWMASPMALAFVIFFVQLIYYGGSAEVYSIWCWTGASAVLVYLIAAVVQFQQGFYDILEHVGMNRTVFAVIGDAIVSMVDHIQKLRCKGSCYEITEELNKPWD